MRLKYSVPLTIAALSACSSEKSHRGPPEFQLGSGPSERTAIQAPSHTFAPSARERIEKVGAEVRAWGGAPDLAEAKRHAEAARNLIVGPAGPGYGDVDGDGAISGGNRVGLLPGMRGSAALAVPAANPCVARDLLGGSWEDPAGRWAILRAKIAAWRPGNNTFPTLPSHAQRIVGWASLALASSDLRAAREYATHAKIHVDVSQNALTRC